MKKLLLLSFIVLTSVSYTQIDLSVYSGWQFGSKTNDYYGQLKLKAAQHYGAMIAFDIIGGEKEAFQFLDNLKLIKLAVSLGGTESLAEHPQTMTHADVDPEDKKAMNITEKLVRLSIGVENYNDIIADINQALK